MSAEILAEYMEAFKALHGRTPKLVDRGNGWYRIDDSMASHRISDLKMFAGSLRVRVAEKEDRQAQQRIDT